MMISVLISLSEGHLTKYHIEVHIGHNMYKFDPRLIREKR